FCVFRRPWTSGLSTLSLHDALPIYAGSLGLFDFDGNLKSTILIRSLHVRDGIASTQASAGIVYDSIPEQEWQETRNKMRACLTVDRKSTRLNSSHVKISYAVFCFKK